MRDVPGHKGGIGVAYRRQGDPFLSASGLFPFRKGSVPVSLPFRGRRRWKTKGVWDTTRPSRREEEASRYEPSSRSQRT